MRPQDAVPMLKDVAEPRSAGLGELAVMKDGRRGRLPLKGVKIRVRAADRAAEVTLTQTFTNPMAEPLEAVYTFPMAGGGAVRRFELRVAGKTLLGLLEERGKARERYDQALAAGKRAALLEADRNDVFTLQVGNLPPGEEAEVTIVYSESLPYFEDGTAELRLPLVVAPRYIPGKPLDREPSGLGVEWDTDQVPDASRITPPRLAPGFDPKVGLSIEVELPAGSMEDLACSQHAVRLSGGRIALARQDELLDRDFILRWRLGSDRVRPSLRATKDGYAMLTLAAPRREGFTGAPRDVVFLLDRSGSMGGAKMASASRACSLLLATLGPADRFGICAFDTRTEWFGQELVKADEAGLTAGNAFLRSIEPRGGTELGPGLKAGLESLSQRGESPRAGVVVIITDGQVGQESEILAILQRQLGDSRVFTVGIDTAVNKAFLERAASLGGGTSAFCVPGEGLEDALRGISLEIGDPVVTDLALEGAEELAPEALRDLFEGRAATVFFKAKGAVTVKGRFRDQSLFEVRVAPEPAELPAIEHLWARARIADLEDRFRAGEDVRKDIIALSIEHSVLSRFTAFVVIDERDAKVRPEERRTVVQPVHLPAQWELDQAAGVHRSRAFFQSSLLSLGGMTGSIDASVPRAGGIGGSFLEAWRPDESAGLGSSKPRAGGIEESAYHGDGSQARSGMRPVSKNEREAAAKLVATLTAALDAAWKEVEAGRLPDSSAIETARKTLITFLAGSEFGAMAPKLQVLLRRGLLELMAALRAPGATASSVRALLERCRSGLAAALQSGSKGRFWEESI